MPERGGWVAEKSQRDPASHEVVFGLIRLLKPGGCAGFSSLMILRLSAVHRASFRRIVENSGSSAYAKSSAFSSGFLGHILRIILRLAIVRGTLVLPRMPRIFGQNGSYQRPSRGIF